MDYFPLLCGLLEVQLDPPLSQLFALWIEACGLGDGPVWFLGGSTNSLNVTYFATTQTLGLLELIPLVYVSEYGICISERFPTEWDYDVLSTLLLNPRMIFLQACLVRSD